MALIILCAVYLYCTLHSVDIRLPFYSTVTALSSARIDKNTECKSNVAIVTPCFSTTKYQLSTTKCRLFQLLSSCSAFSFQLQNDGSFIAATIAAHHHIIKIAQQFSKYNERIG